MRTKLRRTNQRRTTTPTALSWPERYVQIAVMVDAGLAIDHALHTIKDSLPTADKKLARALGLVKRGKSFADAFKTSGILSKADYVLINNAQAAGKLGDGLRHIAERRVTQVQRVRSLKSALLFPKSILVIGGFAGVFIKMNSGGASLVQACLSVTLTLLLFFVASYLFERLLLSDVRHCLSWLWPVRYVKERSERYQLVFESLFFRSLNWQLSSGMDAYTALSNCAHLLDANKFHTQVIEAANELSKGGSLPQTLKEHGLALSKRMQQVLLTSQESGRYQQAIDHELMLQQSKLKHDIDALFKWLPRAYYLVVIVVISRFVLTP